MNIEQINDKIKISIEDATLFSFALGALLKKEIKTIPPNNLYFIIELFFFNRYSKNLDFRHI